MVSLGVFMKKIMIVDDDPDNNFSLKLRLERLDKSYQVIAVESGKQCFDYLKNNGPPDVILLDILMPEMNGWDVYETLRSNDSWRGIPIIFVTSRTDTIAKEAGGFLGDDYVEKPYDINFLQKKIEDVLSRKKTGK